VEIAQGGRTLLTARVAMAGDWLLVQAGVTERNPQLNVRMPWMGSSVELFLAPDGDPGVKVKPAQFFMLPPAENAGGDICAANGPVPDQTRYAARLTPDGWAFELAMPLGALGLGQPARSFRFDLICNANAMVAGHNLLHVPVWGTPNDHADAGLLARVMIGKD